MGERYFLDSDDDGHWYLVEASQRLAWSAWLDLDSDDERAWETPSFAKRLDGAPNQVTFVAPEGA